MPLVAQVGEVEGRAVYICPYCHLRQFLTKSGKCRRCQHSMQAIPKPEAPEERIAVEPPPAPVQSKSARVYEVIRFRLAIIRMSKGWTQHELSIQLARSGELGNSHSWISRVETGTSHPSAGMLDRFSEALGVPVAELTREFSANWLTDEVQELLPNVPKAMLPKMLWFLRHLLSDKEMALEFAKEIGIPMKGMRKGV